MNMEGKEVVPDWGVWLVVKVVVVVEAVSGMNGSVLYHLIY